MKSSFYWLCFFVLVGFNQITSAQQALLNEANMYMEKDYKKALELYEQVLEQDPNNIEALSEAGLILTRLGNRLPNKDEKISYFTKALNYTKKAVTLNPNSVVANYTYSVAIGRMGDISGARERVQNARLIKEHIDHALSIDSTYGPAWHMLGRYNYRFSNMNVAERAAVAVLYGGMPKGVSNEIALSCYEKAVKYKPDFQLYHLDLAIALIKTGNKAKAKEVLETAVSMDLNTPDEKEYMEDCKKLLAQLGGLKS